MDWIRKRWNGYAPDDLYYPDGSIKELGWKPDPEVWSYLMSDIEIGPSETRHKRCRYCGSHWENTTIAGRRECDGCGAPR